MAEAADAPAAAAGTRVVRILETDHKDFIHDIAYDFYGQRLATVSSDKSVKVWEQDKNSNKWLAHSLPSVHSGVVNAVAWAHPEFGTVLASCSADKQVNIYEELVDTGTGEARWHHRTTFSDSRDDVVDIEFAPRHVGLRLAAGSKDGMVRMYEATDVTNVTNWHIVDGFEADKKDVTALSWNPSPFDAHMIAVASQDRARVWEYSSKYRQWHAVADLRGHEQTVLDVSWAPNMARSFHLIATACKDGKVRVFKVTPPAKEDGKPDVKCSVLFERPNEAVWRVEWNTTGTVLASTGDDGKVRLWKQDYQGKWIPTVTLSE